MDKRQTDNCFPMGVPCSSSPPVSERGSNRPRVEAIDGPLRVGKKAWYAAYTAPRHEKVVQAQLAAKQIQSFLPLYTVVRRWSAARD
jgi:Transcription termination factor nusG